MIMKYQKKVSINLFISDFNRFRFQNRSKHCLQQFKYAVKEKNIAKHIIHNIDIFSDSDSDKENTEKESFDKDNSSDEKYDEGNSENVSVYKNGKQIFSKTQRKTPKDINILLKKKKIEVKKRSKTDIKIQVWINSS